MNFFKKLYVVIILFVSMTLVTPVLAKADMRFSSDAFYLSFDDSGIEKTPLDWWFVVTYSSQDGVITNQILYLNEQFDLTTAASINDVKPAAQMNAVDFSDFKYKPVYDFQPGTYNVYYGVDFNQNGKVDMDSIHYKYIQLEYSL